ncbi:MAG: hypothetical protein LUC16_01700, partial [Coprobacillus sp.]|nr:hypothetical protein [Coprobacillus sp.]
DMVGSVRDGVIIYNHLMDKEDFTLNGNLFTIDASQLKWSMTRVNSAKAGNDGIIEFNDNPLIYDSNHSSLSEATATLFAFDGYKLVWENNYYGNYQDPKATAHIINLETNGNKEGKNNTGALTDGSEPSEDTWNQLSSGTITFCKSVNAKTEVDNVITKQYLSAFYAEKTRADYLCFNVNNTKIYDCFGTAFVIYISGNNIVSNSEIKRFGGPVALMFCPMDSSYEEGFFNGYETAGFTIGENVTAEAPLSGGEAWFIIYQLNDYLDILKGLDPFFSGGNALESLLGDLGLTFSCKPYGKTFLDEDGKFNLLSFGLNRKMDGDYLNMQFGVGDSSFSVDSEHEVSEDGVDTTSFMDLAAAYYSSDISKIVVGYSLFGYYVELGSITLPICATNSGKIFAPYYDENADYSIVLIDVVDYFSQINSGTEDPTLKEIEFDETDTTLFMYYGLSLDVLGVWSMTLSFTMSVSFYDVIEEEEIPN